jgi:hypothetical protein
MSPGTLIRNARREAGLTQAELAARLGTTQSAVAAGHRLDLSSHTAPPEVDEGQIVERLRLTPTGRLRSHDASGLNVSAVVRRANPVRAVAWTHDLDTARLLGTLTAHGVDLVVVGGVAAVLHGSARATHDLDTCVAPDAPNQRVLAAASSELGTDAGALDVMALGLMSVSVATPSATRSEHSGSSSRRSRISLR